MAVILLWGILRINCPNSEMIIYLYAVGSKASITLKQAKILYLLELQIIIIGIFHEV